MRAVNITYKSIHDKYMGSLNNSRSKDIGTKYYRHPYIYRLNSADKETYRVKMNKYEILANTGCTSIDR